MATFQARIQALTGISLSTTSTPTLDEVTQFLKDGILDFTDNYIKAFPGEINSFIAGPTDINSASVSIEGIQLVTVLRESGVDGDFRICRRAFPGMESMLQDRHSIHYASKINPAYIQTGDALAIYPVTSSDTGEGGRYTNVNMVPIGDDGSNITYASSDIQMFPEHKNRYIVVYAASKVVEAKMADYTIEEEDSELMQSYAANLQLLRAEYASAFGSPQAPQGGNNEG